MRLSTKIATVFSFFAFLVILSLTWFGYRSGRAAVEQASLNDLISIATEKEASLRQWFGHQAWMVETLSRTESLARRMSQFRGRADGPAMDRRFHDDIARDLHHLVDEDYGLLSASVLDPETGEILVSTVPDEEGKFQEDRPFFTQGKTGVYLELPFFSLDRVTLAMVVEMAVAAPLRSEAGDLVGVVVGRANLAQATSIIDRSAKSRNSLEMFLVNSSHLFLTQPRLLADPAVLSRGIHTEPVNRCLAGTNGSLLAKDYRQVDVLVAFRWLSEHQVCLIVKLDQEEALLPVRDLEHRVLMIGVVGSLAGFVIVGWLSFQISRPIRALQRGVQRVAAGNLEEPLAGSFDGEMGDLAREFDQMVCELGHRQRLQRAAEESLRLSELRLRSLVESAADAILVYDFTGDIIDVNGIACSDLGYTREELTGHALMEIDIAFDPVAYMEIWKKAAPGETRTIESGFRRRDGSVYPVEIRLGLFSVDRTPLMVALCRNITERRRAEQEKEEQTAALRAANEEVRHFAYIVSHDLRAPLVNIRGFAGELRFSLDDMRKIIAGNLSHFAPADRARLTTLIESDIPESMGFVDAAASKMDRLISAVLQLSRFGRREMNPEMLDMNALVSGTLQSLHYEIEEHGAETVIERLPPIFADRLSMEQIIGNILSNAIKYLQPDRPGRIRVWADEVEGGMTIHFQDNGRGLAEEDIPRAFEIFRRVGRQDTPGEGMGLAYVQALARRQGGEVSCDSVLGTGSTFHVFIRHPLGWTQEEEFCP